MRERLLEALDAAGYEVVEEPESIELPAGSGLEGAIIGDAQCFDGNGTRYAYYLRPEPRKPLPQWLGNLASAASELDDMRLYVVVDEVTEIIEKTARAHGAGLLHLTDGNSLDLVVDPADFDEEAVRTQFRDRVRDLRRRMETKMNLKIKVFEENYAGVSELTANMSASKRDSYIGSIEKSITQWQKWGEELSSALDEADATGTTGELDAIEELIEEGAG